MKFKLWKHTTSGTYYACWPENQSTKRKSLKTKNLYDANKLISKMNFKNSEIESREKLKAINLTAKLENVKSMWDNHIANMSMNKSGWVWVMYENAQKRSCKKGINFNLNYNEFLKIVSDTQGMCALTGIPFSFDKPNGSRAAPYQPSIDRIASSGPYSYKNCRVVCYCVNLAISQWGESILKTIGEAFVYKNLQSKFGAEVTEI